MLASSRLEVQLLEGSSRDDMKHDDEGSEHQNSVTDKVMMILCTTHSSVSLPNPARASERLRLVLAYHKGMPMAESSDVHV